MKPEINGFDLFGDPIIKNPLLREKYGEPPFSVIDTMSGSWKNRKLLWKTVGIKSEVGRKDNLLSYSSTLLSASNSTGTSIFDPVLCELMYRWFCPENGTILDPFAGGSVRGIVANYLDYSYSGIELRSEQVESNREQALQILPINNQPQWYCGDSDVVLDGSWMNRFDMIFSCPPYMDLEVYSDDPADLSNMSDEDFTNKYRSIIQKSVKLMKKDGFAVFVIGDVRSKKTGFYKDFITITKEAFYQAGCALYNEAILLESLGMEAMKADRQFSANKKLVKVHQNILVFKKK